jgi:hypothetical protein
MVNQDIRRQYERIRLADRVAFQELEGALLGSLPGRDGLECVDVPSNERCKVDASSFGDP